MIRAAGIPILFVLAFVLLAQDPIFTFTPAHGNSIKGHFSPSGPLPVLDPYDGGINTVDPGTIERIVMTAAKAPYTSKCGDSSTIVITLLNGSKKHGCFTQAAPLGFAGYTAIPSVRTMAGKFVREKR